MKFLPMIAMTQMAEFVQKYIILQDLGQTDDIEIQIYIVSSRTASPVGRTAASDLFYIFLHL